ncbi:winged helix-turn-helix transcriptional regulator [Candidatus Woesearchaeota archaeon]|nr:winged helix-turn-helix transcriptional regulator [Candidatus Woesearchaeota archaeon]
MGETNFTYFLGNTPMVRILDMLLIGKHLDYSISDIAEQAEVSRATFYKMLERLLKEQIIIPTKKYGNMQLYRINLDNPYIKELAKLQDKWAKLGSEELLTKQQKIKLSTVI